MYVYLSRAFVVGTSMLHWLGPSDDSASSAGTLAVAERLVFAGRTEACRHRMAKSYSKLRLCAMAQAHAHNRILTDCTLWEPSCICDFRTPMALQCAFLLSIMMKGCKRPSAKAVLA